MNTFDRTLIACALVGVGVAAGIVIQGSPDPVIVPNTRIVEAVVTVTAPPVTERVTITQRASRSSAVRPGGEARAVPPTNIQARIRWCESRNNYKAENPRSTASGAYQFLDGTWRSVTGLRPPASAHSPAVQDAAFRKLFAASGTRPWNASKGCWG